MWRWVKDREARLHQVLHEVNLSPVKQWCGLRGDEQCYAAGLNSKVAFLAAAGDCHAKLVARAATAYDEHAQGAVLDAALSQNLPLTEATRL